MYMEEVTPLLDTSYTSLCLSVAIFVDEILTSTLAPKEYVAATAARSWPSTACIPKLFVPTSHFDKMCENGAQV